MTEESHPASSPESRDDERGDLLRRLPSVHQLVESIMSDESVPGTPRSIIVDAARDALDSMRTKLVAHESIPAEDLEATLIKFALESVKRQTRPPLAPVINATGIIIHTGLGRAPLAAYAAHTALEAARSYAPVELDLESGQRGKRSHIVRDLLCRLTGAESATVVNNNAAALMITLSTLATGRSVIVSRGELIEIGGSFRLPDVMKAGGAILREVGTTNRTRLTDYEEAIDETTGALMKVHTSNYRVTGFTQSVTTDELATLGKHHDLPVIDDVGSGALIDLSEFGIDSDEPSVAASIEAGADLVLFSGDKLLGGPQAGIIVGKKALVDRIEKNPMMRAMRVDKIILAALGATLQLHRDPTQARESIPVLRSLTLPLDELQRRSNTLIERLDNAEAITSATLHETHAYLGGGSLPTEAIKSCAIRIIPKHISEEDFAHRLRNATTSPVVTRVRDGAIWFDLRTVFPEQDSALGQAILDALDEGLS
ncbi:MAG: L-seryl-tRNA(Sec) selenium transferase [Planctomycetota bacterium]|nr:L-seryl-tRNA(Sec) selenium transferase [Planctomycetota bacterium]